MFDLDELFSTTIMILFKIESANVFFLMEFTRNGVEKTQREVNKFQPNQ